MALLADTVNLFPGSYRANKLFTTLKEEVLVLYERTKPELFEKLISSTPMTGRPFLYLKKDLEKLEFEMILSAANFFKLFLKL